MDQGWIKLHRKLLESAVMIEPRYLQVWIWCLLRAAHQTHKFPFNGKDYEIKAGQFITGREKATEELRISAQTYRSALNYLKSTSRILVKSTNKFTVITVVNWAQYQLDPSEVTSKKTPQLTNQQPTSNQPVTTYKNVKNVKNNNKQLFWKNLKCSISPLNGKIGMYDDSTWKELDISNPDDCTLKLNGEIIATGYKAIDLFKSK